MNTLKYTKPQKSINTPKIITCSLAHTECVHVCVCVCVCGKN